LLGDNETDWANPCFPYAGNDEGKVFIPDIDDMVWVEFEAGDINKPIWVGGPLSRGDVPSEVQDGYPEKHVIKTDQGHKIVFDDSEDDPRLIIEHESGTKTVYFNQETANGTIQNDVIGDFISEVAGNIELNSDSSLIGEAGLSISLSADGSAELSSELRNLIQSNEDVVINAPDIYIGSEDADEQVVLGNQLVNVLKQLISAITSITVPTAFGPSGEPINRPQFEQIKNKLDVILSETVFTEKN
jgi:filamentous hemagglutinin family protein